MSVEWSDKYPTTVVDPTGLKSITYGVSASEFAVLHLVWHDGRELIIEERGSDQLDPVFDVWDGNGNPVTPSQTN